MGLKEIRKNIVANYVGKGWSVVSVYLFVPVYLHFLGIEAYGLVGFYTVLLGVLAFADMGLTATLSREMATLSGARDSEDEMRHLVRTIELVYLGIFVLVALLVLVLAGPIAEHWLNTSSLPVSSVERVIRLMGFAVAFQLPALMYLGGLLGLQRQVLANSIQVVMGMVRNGGAALVLWLISPTIEAFFVWQILSSVLLLLVFRQSLWAQFSRKTHRIRPSLSFLKGVLPYSIGMAIISFNSILFMQIDKITISKMLSLETLGYYSLATTLAHAPLLLSAPIAIAVFPHLTQLMQAGKERELAGVYHRANQLIAAIVFPIGLTLVVFSRELLLLWTQSAQTADNTHLIASLLTVGSMALAIQVIPFRLALSAAWTRLPIYLGGCSIIVIVPLYIFLIQKYGVTGAGISWIVLNCGSGLFFVFFLHRRLLRGHAPRWLLRDMVPSLVLSLTIVTFGRLYVASKMNMAATVLSIGLIAAISCSVCLALFMRGHYGFRLNAKPIE